MSAVENGKINGQTAVCAFGSPETAGGADADRVTPDNSGVGGGAPDDLGDSSDDFEVANAQSEATDSSEVNEVADTHRDKADGSESAWAADCGRGTAGDSRGEAECAWREVYEPVERAIVEEHERRVANRVRRQKERAEEEKRARGDLLEATEGLSAVWERESQTMDDVWAVGDSWILGHLVRAVRKEATRLIDRLRHAERRPMYYETENARRRALAEERRRIRKRTTTNPCPTREQILDGWLHRSDSHEAAIRFGSLMMDLECHLDNSLVFDDDGAIVGRRGGVKRWLQENIPALYLRYTTVMRFKSAAQKLRQIAELRDPVPAAVIVDPPSEGEESDGVGLRRGRNPAVSASDGESGMAADAGLPCGGDCAHETDGESVDSADVRLRRGRNRVLRARMVWQEVVAGIGRSPTALMARIDALTDPRRAGEESGMLAEWKRRHVAEITVRTKSADGRRAGWLRSADPEARRRIA